MRGNTLIDMTRKGNSSQSQANGTRGLQNKKDQNASVSTQERGSEIVMEPREVAREVRCFQQNLK